MKHRSVLAVILLVLITAAGAGAQGNKTSNQATPGMEQFKLTPAVASNFARLALRCIAQEYPNKPDHVLNNSADVLSPRAMHPVFYGCFDWHSSVHGHWMLVRLLRLFPDLPESGRIRAAIGANITAANVKAELQYLDQPGRRSFERTYGWAWLLKLAAELHDWNDPQGQSWSEALAPLARAIVMRYKDFLPRQTYPIRTGVHPNTAFGIAFALDYARVVGDTSLQRLLVERSLTYYGSDKSAPIAWEPGGEDFFSPSLIEADLMRRVLKKEEFRPWFAGFAPQLLDGSATNLLKPAIVSDRSDPKLVHLDGLNLSRAWCMRGIAASLPEGDRGAALLRRSAHQHLQDALEHIASGNYEGEHWLASFAVYALSL